MSCRFQEEKKKKKKKKDRGIEVPTASALLAPIPAATVAAPAPASAPAVDTSGAPSKGVIVSNKFTIPLPPPVAYPEPSAAAGDEADPDKLMEMSTQHQLASLMKETEQLRRAVSGKTPVTRPLSAHGAGSGSGDAGQSPAEIEESYRRKHLVMGADGKWTRVEVGARERDDNSDSEADVPKEKGLVAVKRGGTGPGSRIAALGGAAFNSFATRSEDEHDDSYVRQPPAPVASAEVHANPATLRYLHGVVMGSGAGLVIKQKAVREGGGSLLSPPKPADGAGGIAAKKIVWG